MRAGWLVLVSLLVGCQADTLEQAVSASLAKQDYRLIVRAGRGEVAPGIAPEQQASAKRAAACATSMAWGCHQARAGRGPGQAGVPRITTGACWRIVPLLPASNKSARSKSVRRVYQGREA